ncbi:hypothetical protein B5G34_15360, partial [Flavonifractor sp. An82]|uniref:fibronectin type III domain-containing protein n=1 Tax=Flavonifractor sp. An82 TaxID=1965660 RepID=UPI000B56FFD0
MKKLYQRILSMGLSLCMLFSMAVTAGAVETAGITVSVSEVTEVGASLTIENTSGETGTYPVAYYMVKQAGEDAPDAETLKSSGTQTTDNGFTMGSTTSTAVSVTGLTAGTEYVAYAVVYHAKNQSFSSVASAEFTTVTAGPKGVALSVGEITEESVSLTIENTSGETGTYPVAYYMVKQAGEGAPDEETLKSSGTQTTDSGFTMGSSTSTAVSITGLTAGTEYVAYAVVYHAKNQSFSSVASAEFTTVTAEPKGIALSVGEITEESVSLTIENTSGETGTYPVAYYMVKQAG